VMEIEREDRTSLLDVIQHVGISWCNWIADNGGIFKLRYNYCTMRVRGGEHAFTHIGNLQELTCWNKYLSVYNVMILCTCMSRTSANLLICLRVWNWTYVWKYIAQFVETGARMFVA
jgi:hypothetical protein